MIDIDWITLVVHKRLDKTEIIDFGEKERVRLIGQDYLAYKISELLPEKLRKEGYYKDIYINHLLSVQNFKLRREIDFFGRFFLEANYKELFLKIVNLIIQEGYSFHFTRMDIAGTYLGSAEDIIAKLEGKKTDFGNLMVTIKKKQKIGLYLKAAHSRYQFVVYSKDKDVQRESRAEYREAFYRKFAFTDTEALLRIEQRFLGKDTLILITDKLVRSPDNLFFDEAIKHLLNKGLDKIRMPRSIKALVFTNSSSFI